MSHYAKIRSRAGLSMRNLAERGLVFAQPAGRAGAWVAQGHDFVVVNGGDLFAVLRYSAFWVCIFCKSARLRYEILLRAPMVPEK
ncbi:hypothetical protein [Celeribacter halophilus]|uniref:hypothetical protein n=1 Tax=Celeribacter halophilus TaxID=576117 RepID=UPI003A93C82E